MARLGLIGARGADSGDICDGADKDVRGNVQKLENKGSREAPSAAGAARIAKKVRRDTSGANPRRA